MSTVGILDRNARIPTKQTSNEPELVEEPLPASSFEDSAYWRMYFDLATKTDKDDKALIGVNLDILLLFATLFSAIVTSFTVMTIPLLSPTPADNTSAILLDMLAFMVNGTRPTDQPLVSPSASTDKKTAQAINILFLASLACSLAAAFLAVLGKQWLAYSNGRPSRQLPHTLRAKVRLQQAAVNSGEEIKFEILAAMLPVILEVALVLFWVGLVLYLWSLEFHAGGIVVIVSAGAVLLYHFGSVYASRLDLSKLQFSLGKLKVLRTALRSRHLATTAYYAVTFALATSTFALISFWVLEALIPAAILFILWRNSITVAIFLFTLWSVVPIFFPMNAFLALFLAGAWVLWKQNYGRMLFFSLRAGSHADEFWNYVVEEDGNPTSFEKEVLDVQSTLWILSTAAPSHAVMTAATNILKVRDATAARRLADQPKPCARLLLRMGELLRDNNELHPPTSMVPGDRILPVVTYARAVCHILLAPNAPMAMVLKWPHNRSVIHCVSYMKGLRGLSKELDVVHILWSDQIIEEEIPRVPRATAPLYLAISLSLYHSGTIKLRVEMLEEHEWSLQSFLNHRQRHRGRQPTLPSKPYQEKKNARARLKAGFTIEAEDILSWNPQRILLAQSLALQTLQTTAIRPELANIVCFALYELSRTEDPFSRINQQWQVDRWMAYTTGQNVIDRLLLALEAFPTFTALENTPEFQALEKILSPLNPCKVYAALLQSLEKLSFRLSDSSTYDLVTCWSRMVQAFGVIMDDLRGCPTANHDTTHLVLQILRMTNNGLALLLGVPDGKLETAETPEVSRPVLASKLLESSNNKCNAVQMIVVSLQNPDPFVRGLALETLATWIIPLLDPLNVGSPKALIDSEVEKALVEFVRLAHADAQEGESSFASLALVIHALGESSEMRSVILGSFRTAIGESDGVMRTTLAGIGLCVWWDRTDGPFNRALRSSLHDAWSVTPGATAVGESTPEKDTNHRKVLRGAVEEDVTGLEFVDALLGLEKELPSGENGGGFQ